MNADDNVRHDVHSGEGEAARAEAGESSRRDQYVHYTHEMNEDTAESAARVLIRSVPVVYGLLLGGLIDNLMVGFALGAALMLGLDLHMRDKSMFAPLVRPIVAVICPQVALMARGFGRLLGLLSLPIPARLLRAECGVARD
ncbi:MAG: hypothetical protein KDJ39_09375 [Gammaproteobacteria bacterium]|nr:hypothetical protein [Gammaproteobacteria bacterium]MCP5299833.1 hypothetical protein [Chromatiaceae bacterium]